MAKQTNGRTPLKFSEFDRRGGVGCIPAGDSRESSLLSSGGNVACRHLRER